MDEGSTYELRWPFSAAATFVGLMWIAYAWSIWVAKGTNPHTDGMMLGSLTGAGYYIAGATDTASIVRDGTWERLISGIFLHGGFLHIIMNSAAILQLGRILEAFSTRGRCWFTLLFSGLCGGLAVLIWAQITGTPQNAVGASGAGCGLGTAMIVLSRGIGPLAEFRKQMITWVVVMLAIGAIPIISGTAHVGGAIGGALAGLIIGRRGSVQFNDRYSKLLDRAAVLLTLVFVVALALNAWRATQRRAAREEIGTAVEDVYGWLHSGEIPDTAAWKMQLEKLHLPARYAFVRGTLIGIVEHLAGNDGGRVTPAEAEDTRAMLERLRQL
jgi:membrane associated rhomboid family serine protease